MSVLIRTAYAATNSFSIISDTEGVCKCYLYMISYIYIANKLRI